MLKANKKKNKLVFFNNSIVREKFRLSSISTSKPIENKIFRTTYIYFFKIDLFFFNQRLIKSFSKTILKYIYNIKKIKDS